MKKFLKLSLAIILSISAIVGLIVGLVVDGGSRFAALFVCCMMYGSIAAAIIMIVYFIYNYISKKHNGKELSDKDFVAKANKHRNSKNILSIVFNGLLIALCVGVVVAICFSKMWTAGIILFPFCAFCIGCCIYNIVTGGQK